MAFFVDYITIKDLPFERYRNKLEYSATRASGQPFALELGMIVERGVLEDVQGVFWFTWNFEIEQGENHWTLNGSAEANQQDFWAAKKLYDRPSALMQLPDALADRIGWAERCNLEGDIENLHRFVQRHGAQMTQEVSNIRTHLKVARHF